MVDHGWYFYNLPHSIDEEKPFSSTDLPPGLATPLRTPTSSPQPEEQPPKVIYSASSLRRTINPSTQWQAFNPSDNARLLTAHRQDPDAHIPVGSDQQLFEVVNYTSLRPIYWPISTSIAVRKADWVFSSSLTPVDPAWSAKISQLRSLMPDEQAYTLSLEHALKDPRMLRALVTHLEFDQGDRKLVVDVLFSKDRTKAHLFTNAGSALTSRTTVEALLAGTTPKGVTESVERFDWEKWKLSRKLPDRSSDDPDYVPIPYNRLILVFHGIGQKLSSSYNRFNFVYAIDKLRVLVTEAARQESVSRHLPADKPIRYLVLAVNWRAGVEFDIDYSLEHIMVPSMKSMRQVFGDVMLDIPLYMSAEHQPAMLSAAAKEANRLYDKVVRHNPGFAENGKVNVVGHSLGSLITADLLTRQPTNYNGQDDAPLVFNTDNFFTTGSMLGLFLLLKQSHIQSRKSWDAEPRAAQTPPFGCFAARNVYNLVNDCDMLSYLLNPTVIGDSGENGILQPATIPSAKQMAAATPSGPSSLEKLSTIYQRWTRGSTPPASPEQSAVERIAEHPHLLELNENGQLDWAFSTATGPLGSQYLKLLTAHFEYWTSPDVARFLAVECGRDPGKTVPENRAEWLNQKMQPPPAPASEPSSPERGEPSVPELD